MIARPARLTCWRFNRMGVSHLTTLSPRRSLFVFFYPLFSLIPSVICDDIRYSIRFFLSFYFDFFFYLVCQSAVALDLRSPTTVSFRCSSSISIVAAFLSSLCQSLPFTADMSLSHRKTRACVCVSPGNERRLLSRFSFDLTLWPILSFHLFFFLFGYQSSFLFVHQDVFIVPDGIWFGYSPRPGLFMNDKSLVLPFDSRFDLHKPSVWSRLV